MKLFLCNKVLKVIKLLINFCNICGSDRIQYYGTTRCIEFCVPPGVEMRRQLFKCKMCDSINIFPIPRNEILHLYYNNCAMAQVVTKRWDNRTVTPIIIELSRIKGEGKVLDIGCGNGSLLDLLPPSLEKYGVEIAESAVAEAKTKNIKVFSMPWELAEFDCQFDLIIALDFLEHITDPWFSFKKMVDFLRPDGLLVIETGNADSFIARSLKEDWGYVALFGHLCALSTKALIFYSENANVRVLKIAKGNHYRINPRIILYRGMLAYGFRVIKKCYSLLKNKQLAKNTIFYNILNRSPIQAPLPDHMIFVGQKLT